MTLKHDPPRPHPAWAWAVPCALLGTGSAAVWHLGLSDALAWQSDTWVRQPWRLWTASLVHLSGAHLLGNMAALFVLAILGASLNAGRPAALALLASWPLSTMTLLFWPEVAGYSGLSGLLCAMLGILWVHAALHPGGRAVSWVLLVSMGTKLLSEHAWSQPIGYDPNWGFNVVYAAHLGGFACGAVCGAAAAWRTATQK